MKNPVPTFLLLLAGLIIFQSFKVQRDKKIPRTEEELGKALFFDPILSKNRTISCSSCHNPRFAFADSVAVSKGNAGQAGRRNVPSAMNMAERPYFFYDGRAASLEEQAVFPIQDSLEMDLPIAEAIKRLQEDKWYAAAFKKLYGQKVSINNLGSALAAYERTLETSNSDWDLYAKGKPSGFSEAAIRGRILFNEKGKCFDCHFGPDFTGDEFRNIGLYNGLDLADKGRFEHSRDSADIGKFKVPGLRNIAVTGPYMHNGMFKTLREVVEYYNNPDLIVGNSIGRDSLLAKPLNLNPEEIDDLLAFLETLTDKQFIRK